MNWNTLYSTRRITDSIGKVNNDSNRSHFLRDYDRIVFSSGFRRLQNKTQVFPLPGSVFVHNRLTHSLEVSCVGRSLGKAAGQRIAEKYPNESEAFSEFYNYELSNVIAAACLAHDIGNPPFGHSGENAIRAFFADMPKDNFGTLQSQLTERQLKDFTLFEGNSNALRTLTHRFNDSDSAYNVTFSTLAAIVKYPCTSIAGFQKSNENISTKKSGFFDSEIAVFQNIAKEFDLPQLSSQDIAYSRHPFVYLTEAADDICYQIMDMEDALRIGIVTFDTIYDFFAPFFEHRKEPHYSLEYIKKKLENIKDPTQKVQYIRAVWIGLMTQMAADIFMENEAALLSGTLQKPLLSLLPEKEQSLLKNIRDFSVKNIYNHKSVVEIEVSGFNVIGGLLQEFVSAVLQPENDKSKKLLQIIPQQFTIHIKEQSLYQNLQSVIDFISGMTDVFAVNLFRKIKGISI